MDVREKKVFKRSLRGFKRSDFDHERLKIRFLKKEDKEM